MRALARRSIRLTAAAVLAVALTACGASGPTPAEKTELTVGVLPIIGTAPLHHAIAEGMFTREGLTVTTVPVSTGVAEGLLGDAYDVAYVAYVVPFQALDNGAPLTVIAEGERGSTRPFGVQVLPDSPIRAPADLVGRKIGVPTVAIGTWMVHASLRAKGVDPRQVNLVEVPVPSSVSALRQGSVDAILAPEPFFTAATGELQARVVLEAFEGLGPNPPIAGYFVKQGFLVENPTAAAKFSKVIEAASADLNANPDKLATVVPSFTQLTGEQATSLLLEPLWGESVDTARLQRVADSMQEAGLLRAPLTVGDHVRNAG